MLTWNKMSWVQLEHCWYFRGYILSLSHNVGREPNEKDWYTPTPHHGRHLQPNYLKGTTTIQRTTSHQAVSLHFSQTFKAPYYKFRSLSGWSETLTTTRLMGSSAPHMCNAFPRQRFWDRVTAMKNRRTYSKECLVLKLTKEILMQALRNL